MLNQDVRNALEYEIVAVGNNLANTLTKSRVLTGAGKPLLVNVFLNPNETIDSKDNFYSIVFGFKITKVTDIKQNDIRVASARVRAER